MNLEEITSELQRLRRRDEAHHLALRVLYALPSAPAADLLEIATQLDDLLLAHPLPDAERELMRETLLDLMPQRLRTPR